MDSKFCNKSNLDLDPDPKTIFGFVTALMYINVLINDLTAR